MVTNNDLLANVRIVPDFAISADDGGPFDHRAVLYDGAFTDENVLADKGYAFASVAQSWTQMGLEVFLDPFQRVPDISAIGKQSSVFRLR